jgi:(E)-4-hydroxy-3-methylbut-2-enyl-diphosphate synthase
MKERRKTHAVKIGKVTVGGDCPISIQSMAKTETCDVDGTISQIGRLEKAGCEIVRVAVKDMPSAKAISSIKKGIGLPLVADIHYDHTLALEAARQGADKIRINPGNIKKPSDVEKVIDECSSRGIPIRIGANSGSLPEIPGKEAGSSEAMVEGVLRYLAIFRKRKFDNIVLSLKASDVPATVEAYRKMSGECAYPFHVGVTAAGSKEMGTIKSAMGIGSLLLDGIGDTIRVSLTGDPESEVAVAKKILTSSGSRFFAPEVVSCPTCGRCRVDLAAVSGEVETELGKLVENIGTVSERYTVAVMGCEVNGPGEAKTADVGVAFGNNKGVIFRRGEIVRTVTVEETVKALMDMVRSDLG